MSAIVQRHVRKRGFFGKLFKFLFIAFNVLMLILVINGWVNFAGMHQAATDEVTKAGMEFGVVMGTGVLLFLWVAGSVILGLITIISRGSTVVITSEKN